MDVLAIDQPLAWEQAITKDNVMEDGPAVVAAWMIQNGMKKLPTGIHMIS